MELREIKALLALMRDFGLSELEIEDKKGKVRLVRSSNSVDEHHSAPAGAPKRPAPRSATSPRSAPPLSAPGARSSITRRPGSASTTSAAASDPGIPARVVSRRTACPKSRR